MDSKKLERYLETKYALEDRDYRVRCDTGDDFFQVAVRHLEEEEPDAEELADELLETLYLSEERWRFDANKSRDQTILYAERRGSRPFL
ncbi:MAG: hypothetical protein ABEJ98_04595 [Candidatus Nanohaloarchaea archaeon]